MDTILMFQSTLRKSWRDKLSGVCRFAKERGWFVQVVDRFSTHDDIRRLLQEWQPLGCLVDRAVEKDAPPDSLFGRLPVVYLDQTPSYPSRIHPSLVHDSATSARMACGELLKLKLASYAYIATGKGYFWDLERLAAFRQEIKAAGHLPNVLNRHNLRDSLKPLPKPCGILAANDRCAIEVVHAAAAAGLPIPEHIALVGIDNDEIYCESVSPGITSVEPDFAGAGYKLAQMLEDEIALGEKGRTNRQMPPSEKYGPLRIIRRGSTDLLRQHDPGVSRALEFIRRHACERNLRIDDLLPAMGCSRRIATMRFRKATGHSILDEIQEQRFRQACDLLARTDWPVATIIAQCGYTSDSFAQKMFRRRTGTTMRKYRNIQSQH